jgi:hypothetical protein
LSSTENFGGTRHLIVIANARRSRAIAVNPDGTVADANGDGLVNETDRELLPPTDLVERAH